MTTTKLPTEERPIRMDPELQEQVEKILKGYSGKKLESAQEAVRKVYAGGATGSFHEIVDTYRGAVQEAVKG